MTTIIINDMVYCITGTIERTCDFWDIYRTFFHSMIIYQRCSSVSVYIFHKIIEQQNRQLTQNNISEKTSSSDKLYVLDENKKCTINLSTLESIAHLTFYWYSSKITPQDDASDLRKRPEPAEKLWEIIFSGRKAQKIDGNGSSILTRKVVEYFRQLPAISNRKEQEFNWKSKSNSNSNSISNLELQFEFGACLVSHFQRIYFDHDFL